MSMTQSEIEDLMCEEPDVDGLPSLEDLIKLPGTSTTELLGVTVGVSGFVYTKTSSYMTADTVSANYLTIVHVDPRVVVLLNPKSYTTFNCSPKELEDRFYENNTRFTAQKVIDKMQQITDGIKTDFDMDFKDFIIYFKEIKEKHPEMFI